MLIPPNPNLPFRIGKTCTLPNWYTESHWSRYYGWNPWLQSNNNQSVARVKWMMATQTSYTPFSQLPFLTEKTLSIPNWYAENRLESILWLESVATMRYQPLGGPCDGQMQVAPHAYTPIPICRFVSRKLAPYPMGAENRVEPIVWLKLTAATETLEQPSTVIPNDDDKCKATDCQVAVHCDRHGGGTIGPHYVWEYL